MSIKVAISSSEVYILTHFGKTNKFLIFQVNGYGASQKLIDKDIIPFEESCFITDALDHLSNLIDQLDDI